MIRHIYTKQHFDAHHGSGDWYWKHLCIVLDNEAYGFLTRMFNAANVEIKVVEEDRPPSRN